MIRKGRLTMPQVSSQLAYALICLCAVGFLAAPSMTVNACCVGFAEGECPCEENGEGAENEVIGCSLARHRLSEQRHRAHRQPHDTGDRPERIASGTTHLPATVGHQLANGVRAPLLT